MSQQHYTQRPQEEEINLREEVEKYLRYWPWFVAGVVICILLAVAYLKVTIPTYNTTATIIIKDEESKGPSSDMAAFVDMGLLSGMGTNSIENEIGLLRSRRMMTNVSKALNLNIRYFDDSGFYPREIYFDSPYLVQVLQLDENALEYRTAEEGNTFSISENGEELILSNTETGKSFKTRIGVPVNIGFGDIVINKNPNAAESTAADILVSFATIDGVASNYKEKLQVNLTDKNSSLIELGLEDPVREKARDILDQLVLEYNREAIEDKNLVARNTAEFIDDRLSIINEELDSVETGKEEFKEANSLTDIQAESSLFIENASEYNKRQQEVGTQLELANAMIEYLNSGSSTDLLPANLGIEETAVNSSIQEYNQLVLERNRILSGSTEKNPIVIRLNSQIAQIKANVLQSLERMRSNLRIAQKDLDRQSEVLGSKISAVPSKERQYRGIERQQNIKEALYLFLLQKREENSLSLAVTAPKAKIVDRAYSSRIPVSPKPKIILLAALILGMLIPFMVIYIKNLLNNKVRDRADIERAAKEIPIVGEVPKVTGNQKDIIEKSDRSILAEAFRILHTNLQYLLVNSSDKKTGIKIFITSTVKGEGKTFTAFNLAITLANTGKKVVVVGGDLRNPQLQRYEAQTRSMMGVSDYLVNDSLRLDDLIKPSKLHPDMFLLASGSIPPNPAELWRQDKAGRLFDELEAAFDYVIVDTAPSMLVADTFLINKYADLTLYMVRAGYTEKKLQEFALDAKRDGKLHDVGFVLNDVELSNFGYGNKYGYSYGAEEESFWKKLRNKAAFW
ncbi:GumC family protein [Christiangramia sabulilitoris]|uniref:non-specific protein-tyrosine kinase n=1 Tax=Christiangramia sabulilitoris TaxID=2583991 RepID=A0A550HZU8_9FLAO|nr:polysaccharide biosynthesis tyrosine autokinase [Christiangramia sabulilitoris]TRO64259.1 polysaccharide biosynthesis tyrosine autokinase [Christiangramia sabulilitoris]